MFPGGGDGGKKNSRVLVPSLLKDTIKEVERLERRRREDGERFDRVCRKLYNLEKAVEDQEGGAPARRTRRVAKLPPGPASTVLDFHMEVVGGGKVVVSFDNGKQVTLSPTLREILVLLARDTGESPDDLVAWKSLDRLGELLEKRLGREFDHHAVSQLLWRLREAFKAVDLDRGLIESAPELGARLRLKRRPLLVLYAG